MRTLMQEDQLNLTIGAFNFEFSVLFGHDEDGEVIPALASLRLLLDTIGIFGNFNIRLRIAKEDKIGESSESGYRTGVLGMLQRQEVDVCFLPLALDTPDAPGLFSPVVYDEAYYIYSFPRTSSTVTQNVAKSLESIRLSVWIMVAAITLILELLIQCSSKSKLLPKHANKCESLRETVKKSLNTFGSTVFGQYIPDRSIIRLTQVISIMFLTMILNASFSTSTISGDEEKSIDSLKDAVEQDKKPFFIEGQSVSELFHKGVSKDYAAVYELAKREGTSEPIPISSLALFDNMGNDIVYFCSNEIARAIGQISKTLGKEVAKNEHKSAKAYHRSLTAFLANPAHLVDETKRRIYKIAIRQIQGSIFITYFRRIINEVLVTSPLGITPSQMISSSTDSRDGSDIRTFSPLQFEGCTFVFIVWVSLIGIAIIIFFIEIIVGRLMKKVQFDSKRVNK